VPLVGNGDYGAASCASTAILSYLARGFIVGNLGEMDKIKPVAVATVMTERRVLRSG